MNKETEYIPFGEEWKNEVKKLNKDQIINLYRDMCIENQIIKSKLKSTTNN